MSGWGRTAKGRSGKIGMNKLESDFLQEFIVPGIESGKIRWWLFESIKLKLADNTFYTPDFDVMNDDDEIVLFEVKGGFFPEHNRVKTKVAADRFPIRIIMARRPTKEKGEDKEVWRARKAATPWIFEEI